MMTAFIALKLLNRKQKSRLDRVGLSVIELETCPIRCPHPLPASRFPLYRTLTPFGSHTSTTPKFLARIGASILDKSPATTTTRLSGVSLLVATFCTSAGVTADSRSRYVV